MCFSDVGMWTILCIGRQLQDSHGCSKARVESSRDGHGEVGWDDWWSQIPSFCCGEGDLKVLFVGFSIGTCALCWCIHLFYSSNTIICNQPSLRQSGNAIHVTGHSLGGGVAAILIAGLTDLGLMLGGGWVVGPRWTCHCGRCLDGFQVYPKKLRYPNARVVSF